ncbi:MAG: LysR family transcriptional regulator [Oscillospiraceae bacterium]
MDIQQLIYAVEVNKCGSISKAAGNLYMAQPNLSNSIRELEREIGIVIFKRTPKGIETTKDGAEFLRHAVDVIAQMNALEQYYSKRQSNMLRISITSMRSSSVCHRICQYINILNREGKPFRIHFKEATNYDVISDIASDQAAVGILRANDSNFEYFHQLADAKNMALVPLPEEMYCILMSAHHPLAEVGSLTAEMLTPYTEVIHGDFETPWYPYSNVYRHALPADNTERLIFTYDRGTLLDLVRDVDGAFAWTMPTHPYVLRAYSLIERHCEDSGMASKEAVIFKKNSALRDDIDPLIGLLTNPPSASGGI